MSAMGGAFVELQRVEGRKHGASGGKEAA